MRTRALWTDTDEATFIGARPIMMEGIANFVTEPDLLSRSIILTPAPLTSYRSENELRAAFDECKGAPTPRTRSPRLDSRLAVQMRRNTA